MNHNLSGIKHVSFDVWGTLISPNPEYAKKRNEFIAMALGLDVGLVKARYTSIKTAVDTEAEQEGYGPSTPQVLSRFMESFGDLVEPHIKLGMFEIHSGVRALFRRYPPIVLPEIHKMLAELKSAGFNISIASNTNFIAGTTMQDVLFDKWATKFDFALYSDAFRYSKPSPVFFTAVYHTARTHQGSGRFDRAGILHVGDNAICDLRGAEKASMRGILVSNPAHTAQLITP